MTATAHHWAGLLLRIKALCRIGIGQVWWMTVAVVGDGSGRSAVAGCKIRLF
ncbi:hypothetical protein CASFOL_002446 [Castilleja foliolosa]|uniref:Uncharacterized protein n=1 Tax=Castilleja foliolosa TaxID=1961234 RepID=A0ABD3EI24_9LAMI